jgi:hypothetical protein
VYLYVYTTAKFSPTFHITGGGFQRQIQGPIKTDDLCEIFAENSITICVSMLATLTHIRATTFIFAMKNGRMAKRHISYFEFSVMKIPAVVLFGMRTNGNYFVQYTLRQEMMRILLLYLSLLHLHAAVKLYCQICRKKAEKGRLSKAPATCY